eukprot:763447-Hanusia_phi.AAC.2
MIPPRQALSCKFVRNLPQSAFLVISQVQCSQPDLHAPSLSPCYRTQSRMLGLFSWAGTSDHSNSHDIILRGVLQFLSRSLDLALKPAEIVGKRRHVSMQSVQTQVGLLNKYERVGSG